MSEISRQPAPALKTLFRLVFLPTNRQGEKTEWELADKAGNQQISPSNKEYQDNPAPAALEVGLDKFRQINLYHAIGFRGEIDVSVILFLQET